jgi:hypothetical protein
MPDFNGREMPVLADVTPVIIAEGEAFPSIPDYLDSLQRRYAPDKWAKILQGVAELVEPVDPTLGIDPDKPRATNFFYGTLIGMRTAEEACDKGFASNLIAKTFQVRITSESGGIDAADRRHRAADTSVDFGRRGLASNDPNVQIAARWEDVICRDVRFQNYTSIGLGFVLQLSHLILAEIEANRQAQEQLRDRVQFKREVEQIGNDGIDWDTGFAELY